MAIVNASALIAGRGGPTNYVRNPRLEGAVAGVIGSGGAYPTNWSYVGVASGLTTTIGTGTDAATGLSYVDVQLSGTTAVGQTFHIISFDSVNGPSAPFDIWAASAYFALVGGDLTNISVVRLQTVFAGVVSGAIMMEVMPGLTGTLQRFGYTSSALATTTGATLRWYISFPTTGVPINVTIRVAGPQLENNLAVTPIIRPPVGAPAVTNAPLIAIPPTILGQSRIDGRGGQTNLIRNPRFEGAIAGSPGTLPTYWTMGSIVGLTRTITLGIDGATGLPYMEIRLVGTTATPGSNLRLDTPGGIGANLGDTFALSAYVALVAGSLTNITAIDLALYNSNGVVNIGGPFRSPITLTGTLQRFSAPITLGAIPTTTNVWPVIDWQHASGVAVDFTLRVAGPQIEYGNVTTAIDLPPAGFPGPSDNALSPDAQVFTTPVRISAGGGITNAVWNPNSENAVVGVIGSGGAIPSQWQLSATLGLTAEIVASDVADPVMGLPYLDFRLSGTVNATGAVLLRMALPNSVPNIFTIMPMIAGDIWSQSFWGQIVGGSTANTSFGQVIYNTDNNGVATTNTTAAVFTPTATLQRLGTNGRVVPVNANTRRGYSSLWFSVTLGNVVDFTLRIIAPQLENSPVATPPILPPLGSPGFTTRGLLAMPVIGNWANINGVASVRADGRRIVFASARINGVAGVSSNAQPMRDADASIGGIGSVAATARVLVAANARIDGVGESDQPPPNVLMRDGAVVGGVGGVRADGTQIHQTFPANSTIAGIGTIATTAMPLRDADALIAGVGSVAPTAAVLMQAASRIAGVGSVSANAQPMRDADASIGGVGGVAASAQPMRAANARIAGAGDIDLGVIAVLARAQALISGAASVQADTVTSTPRAAATLIGGVGSFRATAQVEMPAFAEIDGVGESDQPPPQVRAPTTAQFGGLGSVRVTAQVLASAGGVLIAADDGSVTGAATSRLLAAARINGDASVSLLPTGAQLGITSIAGVGNLSANAVPARGAFATITGDSLVVLTGSVRAAATSLVPGAGSVAAVVTAASPGIATLPGVGNVLDDGRRFTYASATIAGIASVAADGTQIHQTFPANTTIAGVGNVTAPATAFRLAVAIIAGDVSFSANGLGAQPTGNQLLAGVGSVAATATVRAAATAEFDGVGSVAAATLDRVAARGPIDGVGNVITDANPARVAAARLPGVASVQATGTAFDAATATIAGLGGVQATVSGAIPALATIAGVATVSANALRLVPAACTIAGLGGVQGLPGVAGAGLTVTLVGVGSVRAPGQIAAPVTATVAGVGSVRADGTQVHQTLPVSAQIDGVGLVGAAGIIPAVAQATIAGAGSLRVAGTLPIHVAARIGGVGAILAAGLLKGQTAANARINGVASVQANALVRFRAAFARIDGAGSVHTITKTPAVALSTLVISYTPVGGARNDFDGDLGFIFTPVTDQHVNWIGLLCPQNPVGLHVVRIFAGATLTTVRSATIDLTGKTPGQWYYVPIQDITLVAGNAYYVNTVVTAYDGQLWANEGPTTVNNASNVFSAYSSNTGAFPTTSLANAQLFGLDLAEGAVAAASDGVIVIMHARGGRIRGTGTIAVTPKTARPGGARIHGIGAAVLAFGDLMRDARSLIAGRATFKAVSGIEAPRFSVAVIGGAGQVHATAVVHAAWQASARIGGDAAFKGSHAPGGAELDAAARLAGTGSLAVTSRPHRPGDIELDAEGWLAADASVRAAARARVGGLGALAATVSHLAQTARARIAGLGLLDPEAGIARAAATRVHGAGHLAANATVLHRRVQAGSAIHGVGTVHASSAVRLAPGAHAKVAGTGTLRVNAATVSVLPAPRVRIAGTGALSARARVIVHVIARIAGAAQLRAGAFKPPFQNDGKIHGVGQVRAKAAVDKLVHARIAGHATVTAHATLVVGAHARISGLGRLRASLRELFRVHSLSHGVGTIHANAHALHQIHAAAHIAGEAMVVPDGWVPRDRVARYGVHLPPTARGVALSAQPPTDEPVSLPPTRRSVLV